jgi:hypothetical protein
MSLRHPFRPNSVDGLEGRLLLSVGAGMPALTVHFDHIIAPLPSGGGMGMGRSGLMHHPSSESVAGDLAAHAFGRSMHLHGGWLARAGTSPPTGLGWTPRRPA